MNNSTEYMLRESPKDYFTDTYLLNILEGGHDRRYGLVKRAVASGDILHLRRGLYCRSSKYQRHGISLFELAQKIYGPSYISLESALSYHGWIPEAVYLVTNASMKKSKDFQTPLGLFSFKHIPCEPFYDGVERIASEGGSFFVARPLKALVDYIYLYKKDWKNLKPLMESLRIEPEELDEIKSEEIDMLLKNYSSRRVQRFLKGIRKELRR